MSLPFIGILVSVASAALLVWLVRSGRGAAPKATTRAPERKRWALVFRWSEPADVEFAQGLLDRQEEGRASPNDVLLDLLRLVRGASHFYAGGPVQSVRCDASEGLLLRLDVFATHAPVHNLGGCVALLENLDATSEPHLAGAHSSPDGQPMQVVNEAARPGHRRCASCQASFSMTLFECPTCGARVQA